MQAIIVAAGLGSRLRPLTDSLPKCMLEIDGKSIIQHQVDTLRSAGIEKITIITGHCHEKIRPKGDNFTYFFNSDYQNNNILESLFYGEDVINGEVVILYSDIIFKKSVIEKLLESKDEISLVVDADWRKTYFDRKDHPIAEGEFVILGEDSQVRLVGKIFEEEGEGIAGEFIGMMKLSGDGAEKLKSLYHGSQQKYKSKPFQRALSIKVAYLTDLLQELVDQAIPVFCVIINDCWREIDTAEDFKKAVGFFKIK